MSTAHSNAFRGLFMALALTAGLAAASDADAMSRKDKRTLVGAVVGGVAGHVISNGDTTATVGGAIAGGAIGNLTTKDRRDHRDDRYYRDHRYHRDDRRWQSDNRRWERDRDRRDWDRRHHGRHR